MNSFEEEEPQALAQAGGWLLESCFAEKALGSLWTPNWTLASNKLLQQRQPTASRGGAGEPLSAGWRKLSFLSSQQQRDASGMLGPALGSPLQEPWTYWREFSTETQRQLRVWNTWHMGRGWERWNCLRGDLISVDKCLTGGVKRSESDSSLCRDEDQ